MRILIVGGGGREHTLAWKLAGSPRVERVMVAPGNGGTAGSPTDRIVNLTPETEGIPGLLALAREQAADLTVVGPEAPLAEGIVDAFAQEGLAIFGPGRKAARLETNKAYAKGFMRRHGIPTARYALFTDPGKALAYVRGVEHPVVVKAAGLAAGKGVIVPDTREEAADAIRRIMVERAFGDAGDELVVEERLEGQEASVLAFCDGRRVLPMMAAQDHKPAYDGDRGPNTGGMGAYAPTPVVTPEMMDRVVRRVLEPTVQGLSAEGHPYVGILYAGLMIWEGAFQVLEYNCRFGDPEAQVLLPLLEGDLAEILEACVEGRLDRIEPAWRPGAAATVVAASEGYPGAYPRGRPIEGLEAAAELEDVLVFHAGTRRTEAGWETAGGRVLTVTGLGPDLPGALERAYAGLERIRFEGMHYRRDIGAKAL